MNIEQGYRKYIGHEKICYFLLCLAPILHMYKFISIITVGELAISICVILTRCDGYNFRYFKLSKLLGNVSIMLVYYGTISVIGGLSSNADFFIIAKEYLVWVIYFIIGFILLKRIDIEKFIDIYQKFAIILSAFIIIQYISYFLFRIHVPGMIPNLTTSYGTITNHYNDVYYTGARANGFFTEPSFAALYLAIPSIASVFHLKKVNRIIDVSFILINLGLLLTLSGTAIVILIFSGVIYVKEVLKLKRDNIVQVLLIVILFVFIVRYISTLETFQNMFSRINEIVGKGQFNSGYIRITRGFVAFMNLPSVSKLFGIGFGRYADVVNDFLMPYLTTVTTTLVTWLNDIQTYLINGGIVGIFLYFIYLFTDFRIKTRFQVYVLFLFLTLQFIDNIFCAPGWLFYFLVIYSTDNYSVERS